MMTKSKRKRPQVLSERIYSMRELRKKLPIDRSADTLHRWCTTGLKNTQEKVVLMESVVIGGSFHSSVEAYIRFMERLQE